MSQAYPDYNYSAMNDPPLPLRTPGTNNTPRSSPRPPRLDRGARLDPMELQAIVPAAPSPTRTGNGATQGGAAEFNYDNNVPVIKVPSRNPLYDSTDSMDYDDAISIPLYQNVGPTVRHLQRKGTRTANSRFLELKNQVTSTQNLNDRFLKSVMQKDLPSVDKDIKGNPLLASATDHLGVTALENAVLSGDVALVNIFISAFKGITVVIDVIDHAILYSIRENNLAMVKHLVDKRDTFESSSNQHMEQKKKQEDNSEDETAPPSSHSSSSAISGNHIRFSMAAKTVTKLKGQEKKVKAKLGDGTWAKRQERQLPGFEDAEFPSFITPAVLAAKLGRRDILNYLIESDNCEIHPLSVPSCPFPGEGDCEICVTYGQISALHSVEDSMRMLEIYRALSSPAFIFSTTDDPILEAFNISHAMDHMQTQDPAFKAEYKQIKVEVQKFATDLLQLCRSSLEIRTMLSQEKDVEKINTAGASATYPRILLALYYQQKEFIAHPHCQKVTDQMWHTDLPEWVCKASCFSVSNICYILLWLIGLPLFCLGFMFKVHPRLIRFMKAPYNRLISDNISFAIFIGLLVANAITSHGQDDTQGKIFSHVEFVIIAWVFAMTCRLLKMAFRHRHKFMHAKFAVRVKNSDWRWLDTIILLCYWLWILIRVGIMIHRNVDGSANLPRYLWAPGHPFLIAEAFYAIGVLLSVVRLNNLVQMHSSLGPLQISLKKMVGDIVRFSIIFFIIMSAFVLAISKFYSNYEGSKRREDGKITREQDDSFIGFKKTYKNLFWSLFEYPDVLEAGKIVVNSTLYNHTEPVRHGFTELFGLTLIGVYHCVAGVVMLNMLIAMMANSYNAIQRNSDMEWKFARTRLRMMYQNEVGSLPPPFNLTLIGHIIKGLQGCCAKCSTCCDECMYKVPTPMSKCDYKKLILLLSTRYWSRVNKKDPKQKD